MPTRELDSPPEGESTRNHQRRKSRLGTRVKYSIMTSHVEQLSSIAEICEGVKRLGYGASQSIRLYGEEFEVISDPFPEAGGIAVSARTKKSEEIRVVQLPATVLQSVKGRSIAA
ncbi:MAG TPA: hypothetical protein VKB49_17635 [Candidatus Sulfotelmatobacter sp.]|nr:hypothetical protein [Candidatus Sulfotelmatobacter sp.]